MAPDSRSWSLEELSPPWGTAPSLYIYIRDNPNSHDLPDEQRDPNKIRFAPGAWDGVVSHHIGGNPAQHAERVEKIERPLEKLLFASTDPNLKELYDVVISDSIYSVADELARRVAERFPDRTEQIGAIGRYFAAGADKREATKFGILLLSVGGQSSDVRLLEILAGHDEFTLFAAVTLSRLVDDPEQCVWRLAQKVHGWGRVHLVERLDGTSNPEIQDWMLREGFSNSIMDNYLAEICARNGKLHEALQRPVIDLPLLDSAGQMIASLLQGGPSAGIDDYQHAPEALKGYLAQLSQQSDLNLNHFLTVDDLRTFLNDEPSWHERYSHGWTPELRSKLRLQNEALLARENWLPKVEEALASGNPQTFYIADVVAGKLGQNTWAIHFRRAQEEPLGNSWYRLMQLTDESNIDQVINLAVTALPLKSIASGPGESLGLGAGFEAHSALDFILQALSRFPERGWALIETGLQSPVGRNRHMALTALLAWPREHWPAGAFPLLQQAERLEPSAGVKERLSQAIKIH